MIVLSGKYKNRTLKTPKSDKTRPTSSKVRESVFNILQNVVEGARVLDLYAGSGSMGIEALSRGAQSATFVENDRKALACIRENLQAVDEEVRVFPLDATVAVKRLVKEEALFDLIYVDPPYHIDIIPLLKQLPPLLAEGGMLLLEQSSRTPLATEAFTLADQRKFGDTTLFLYIK
jgi:16S rRNA (guanine(966)-N(2))-methyltransferase RsmD